MDLRLAAASPSSTDCMEAVMGLRAGCMAEERAGEDGAEATILEAEPCAGEPTADLVGLAAAEARLSVPANLSASLSLDRFLMPNSE